MTSLNILRDLYKSYEEQAIQDYFTFLRFESVSSEPKYKSQVNACADWVMAFLKKIGFQTELWQGKVHPVIFASYLKAGPEKPTLLIYNHYDVQPVEPLEEWISPPFEPTMRNGEIYARGAQDNKGQCFYTLIALKALLEKDGCLPVNIKLCIEGEEECGSASLSELIKEKRKELKADYLAIVDMGLQDANTPAVTLGVRGIVTMDVEAEGALTDGHSGFHGGILYNPIHALIEVLNKLRNVEGKIAIPGFYDDVAELTSDDRKKISFSFDENKYEKMFGVKATGGEKGYSPLERSWTRPTIEINGISGGYSGSGFKTVIPAKASAKVSCRLVPNQDPHKIAKLVTQFLEKNAPEGIRIKTHIHPGGGKAERADPSSAIVQSFAKAYEEVFNAPCQFSLSGGSIPIVPELAEVSQSQVVLLGLGLPDDQIHAPNEHFGKDRLEKGFLIIARALELLGNINKR